MPKKYFFNLLLFIHSAAAMDNNMHHKNENPITTLDSFKILECQHEYEINKSAELEICSKKSQKLLEDTFQKQKELQECSMKIIQQQDDFLKNQNQILKLTKELQDLNVSSQKELQKPLAASKELPDQENCPIEKKQKITNTIESLTKERNKFYKNFSELKEKKAQLMEDLQKNNKVSNDLFFLEQELLTKTVERGRDFWSFYFYFLKNELEKTQILIVNLTEKSMQETLKHNRIPQNKFIRNIVSLINPKNLKILNLSTDELRSLKITPDDFLQLFKIPHVKLSKFSLADEDEQELQGRDALIKTFQNKFNTTKRILQSQQAISLKNINFRKDILKEILELMYLGK